MRILRYLLLTFLAANFSTAQANMTNELIYLSVPFQNFSLNPNQTIKAGYTFAGHPIIFCYENNLQTVGILTWPFKGKIKHATLSTELKTDPKFQGEFADPKGIITVTNNQKIVLITSCDYGF